MDPELRRLQDRGSPDDEVAVLVRLHPGAEADDLLPIARFGDVLTCRVQRAELAAIHAADHVVSIKAPRQLGGEPVADSEQDVSARRDRPPGPDTGRPDRIRPGDRRRPPGLPETGAGTVVGVVDWDCDFAHPDFRHPDGSTRLLALWDQATDSGDGSPDPYGYGTLHTRAQIDRALHAGDPYRELGYHPARGSALGTGHGSHVLGIAAGNGRSGAPSGVAPAAELVFVHLASLRTAGVANLGDSVTLLEAVDFVDRTAAGRPWAVNVSVGAHGGPHDDTTLVEQALDSLVTERPGRMVCHSVGNYRRSRTHAYIVIESGTIEALEWEITASDPTTNELEIWYPGRDRLTVTVQAPDGAVLACAEPGEHVQLRIAEVSVGDLDHRVDDPNNHDNHIEVFLDPGAPAGRWTILLTGVDVIDGRCHAWIERDNLCPECQSRFSASLASPFTTTGTICNGRHTIAVGAYDHHDFLRPVAPFSSWGPTRDGRIKPNLVAPGKSIASARSRGGPGHQWIRLSGSSMAAPHVTGAVALLNEAAGRPLDAHEVRALLLGTAQPGPLPPERSGAGYLDLDAAVAAARLIQSIGDGVVVCGPERTPTMDVHTTQSADETTADDSGVHRAAAVDAAIRAGLARTAEAVLEHLRLTSLDAGGPTRPGELFDAVTAPLRASGGVRDLFDVVALPGRPMPELSAGDLLVRRALGEGTLGHLAVLATGQLMTPEVATRLGLSIEPGSRDGEVVHVLEPGPRPRTLQDRFARRVTDAYGRARRDTLVLRPAPDLEAIDQTVLATIGAAEPEATIDEATTSPTITGPLVVVVRKPYTTPARQRVDLGTSAAFSGSGRLERSHSRVRLFDAAVGGSEVTFDGVHNVFTGAALTTGITLYAEGRAPSKTPGDVTLTLTLTDGGTVAGRATHTLTAVELFLDVHASRTAAGKPPAALPTPTKITTGRFIQVQDAGLHAGRAMLTVRPAAPSAFTGVLVLTPLDAHTRLFRAADEVAAPGQSALPTPVTLRNSDIPATGAQLWVEGAAVSGALRDTALQLGVVGIEPDGDRVALTVVELSNLAMEIPTTPARTARLGNSPVPPQMVPGNAVPVPADFDESPRVNPAVPLLENSIVTAAPIRFTVAVRPAGVPVRWGAQRARGIPAADGGDDAPAVVTLRPRAAPTVTQDPLDPLAATMLTDNVGTFHVRPFIDANGSGRYEHGIDREPSIVRNVVLGRATLFLDSSVARSTNFTVTPAAGGIRVSSGSFDITAPATTAMHLNAQIDLITGGADGRRLVDQYFGGWINNETAVEAIRGTFRDGGTAHTSSSVFASNLVAATGGSPGNPIFLPGDPAPVLITPSLLDSGRGAGVVGRGGDSATLTRSRIRSRTALALGQRWIVEAVDSPGDGEPPVHPGFPGATLRRFHFGLTFSSTLVVWTNRTAASGATGHPADRVYAVVLEVRWTQEGEWTVTPATGAIAVVDAPKTALAGTTKRSPAVAAASTPVEVRFPASTDQLARDART